MAERPRSGGSPRGGPRGATGHAAGKTGAGKAGAGKAAAGKAGAKKDAAQDEPDVRAQMAAPLARILKRLPETQRRVLELRMGLTDGHPHAPADAARVLGISLGELREIEARAFERIREVIPLQQLQRFLDR
jgi:DNA-directed RNA polymerase sigma subunit (sigma70/sigma32)